MEELSKTLKQTEERLLTTQNNTALYFREASQMHVRMKEMEAILQQHQVLFNHRGVYFSLFLFRCCPFGFVFRVLALLLCLIEIDWILLVRHQEEKHALEEHLQASELAVQALSYKEQEASEYVITMASMEQRLKDYEAEMLQLRDSCDNDMKTVRQACEVEKTQLVSEVRGTGRKLDIAQYSQLERLWSNPAGLYDVYRWSRDAKICNNSATVSVPRWTLKSAPMNHMYASPLKEHFDASRSLCPGLGRPI